MTSVLVVDDEPQIVRAIRVALGARGFDVRSAGNGETAIEMLATAGADLVLLDIGLPGIDGIEVTRRIRGWSDVPIIVLSVRDGQSDKVAALDAGADDYVTKPFGMEELLARTRAALRRAPGGAPPPTLHAGPVTIDLARRTVTRDGEHVRLTPTEWRLLEAFANNRGKLLTHRWLLGQVWGPGYGDESQYLRVYVGNLRRKLEDDPSQPRTFLTEAGLGYRMADEVTPGGTAPT